MLQKKPSTPSHHPPSGKIRKNTPPINFLIESSPKELDERYSYLQKFGKLKKSIDNGNIIFSELLQIPGVWICYRHPKQRQASIEKLQLESLELEHVPLLEGEEKLKVLSLQHNKIKKIENLVSLPNLLYLDLLDNKIEIIENIDNLHNLRILLMPQNAVCEIKSLQIFSKLEVLDLHSNKIRKLQSFKSLKSLKILNLADNLIENIEGLEDLISLEELNLKMNQIQNCKKLKYLNNLQKLFLCENKILSVVGLEGLTKLEELSLDGNEICSQMDNYVTEIFQQFQSLKILDHKEKSSFFINEENNNINKNNFNENFEENEKFDENENFNKNENFVKNENNNEKKLKKVPPEKNEKKLGRNQILEIIKELWEKELEKIKKATMIESLNKTNCKSTIINEKETFVLDSGHAEIDSDTSLFIYGNAFKVVLLDEKHHRKIKKVVFIFIELILKIL